MLSLRSLLSVLVLLTVLTREIEAHGDTEVCIANMVAADVDGNGNLTEAEFLGLIQLGNENCSLDTSIATASELSETEFFVYYTMTSNQCRYFWPLFQQATCMNSKNKTIVLDGATLKPENRTEAQFNNLFASCEILETLNLGQNCTEEDHNDEDHNTSDDETDAAGTDSLPDGIEDLVSQKCLDLIADDEDGFLDKDEFANMVQAKDETCIEWVDVDTIFQGLACTSCVANGEAPSCCTQPDIRIALSQKDVSNDFLASVCTSIDTMGCATNPAAPPSGAGENKMPTTQEDAPSKASNVVVVSVGTLLILVAIAVAVLLFRSKLCGCLWQQESGYSRIQNNESS